MAKKNLSNNNNNIDGKTDNSLAYVVIVHAFVYPISVYVLPKRKLNILMAQRLLFIHIFFFYFVLVNSSLTKNKSNFFVRLLFYRRKSAWTLNKLTQDAQKRHLYHMNDAWICLWQRKFYWNLLHKIELETFDIIF